MFKRIVQELDSIFARDPAARSRLEVLLCYPGVHAVMVYRLTHWLWKLGLKLPARFLGYVARIVTGIEIHPAAVIGRNLFIDHGFGVVIGETATIGDEVTIYHDVTLGGTSLAQGRRHPQLGNGVIVGAGAQLLGPISVGDGARIGSNAVVIADVPPHVTVVGVPARPVKETVANAGENVNNFEAYGTPKSGNADPMLTLVAQLSGEIDGLKARIAELEAQGRGIEHTATEWEGGNP